MENIHWQSKEIEAVEVNAFFSVFDAAPQSMWDQGDLEYLSIGDGCALSFPSSSLMGFNRIFGVSNLTHLATAENWLRARAGARSLHIDPSSLPQEVTDWIREHGLVEHAVGRVTMTRRASDVLPPPASQILTREAEASDATLFADLMCEGFGLPASVAALWSNLVYKPEWSCFIAELDQKPVGAAAMYAYDGYAWLGGAVTLEQYRNRGVQKALIRARLVEGVNRGVHTFAVETVEPQPGEAAVSNANLAKAGFRTAYSRKFFLLPE